jgi:heat shock protein HslJ
MRQTLGFLFFMLFLAGFAFVTLKNLRSAESIRNANGENDKISIVSGSWNDPATSAGNDQVIFVRFHPDGKISGFAGCNSFFGTYVATDRTLVVGPLGATRMACSAAIMQREMAFLARVESAAVYTIAARVLTLTADDGASLQLHFESAVDK